MGIKIKFCTLPSALTLVIFPNMFITLLWQRRINEVCKRFCSTDGIHYASKLCLIDYAGLLLWLGSEWNAKAAKLSLTLCLCKSKELVIILKFWTSDFKFGHLRNLVLKQFLPKKLFENWKVVISRVLVF